MNYMAGWTAAIMGDGKVRTNATPPPPAKPAAVNIGGDPSNPMSAFDRADILDTMAEHKATPQEIEEITAKLQGTSAINFAMGWLEELLQMRKRQAAIAEQHAIENRN
jgi:hypothetical protein